MLDSIVSAKRQEISIGKRQRPLAALLDQLTPGSHALQRALDASDWLLLAECKIKSPAKGRLTDRHCVSELAALYEPNGAGALSIHTDPHFAGSLDDLAAIRKQTTLPLLRKDFIVDPYQLFESRAYGADAVLLIARLLTDEELVELHHFADQLGMDALVEVHDAAEFERVQQLNCPLIGINNRDLTTFRTDIENTFRLLQGRRPGVRIVSESGIRNAADAAALYEAGVDAILVGESLSTAADPGQAANQLAHIHHHTTRRNYHA